MQKNFFFQIFHDENITILDICDSNNVTDVLKTKYHSQNILFIKTDVSKKEQVKSAFDQAIQNFGSIDIVIGNAGILCESDYERTINVNLV